MSNLVKFFTLILVPCLETARHGKRRIPPYIEQQKLLCMSKSRGQPNCFLNQLWDRNANLANYTTIYICVFVGVFNIAQSRKLNTSGRSDGLTQVDVVMAIYSVPSRCHPASNGAKKPVLSWGARRGGAGMPRPEPTP